MGSERRPTDKFFSSANITEIIKVTINIVHIDFLPLNWGDESPPFVRERKLCGKKEGEKLLNNFTFLLVLNAQNIKKW
jgi:hypothetical protein